MKHRILSLSIVAAGIAVAACTSSTPDTGDATGWKQPMTEWGDPDLRGMWPIGHLIGTPFQRPEKFGDRRFMSEEEYAEEQQSLVARNTAYEKEEQSNKLNMGHWAEATEAQKLTSLLVDPPNGRFPELTEIGKAKAGEMHSSWSATAFDSPADFDTWDRCITRGLPPSMFPFNYNNGVQILQSPGYVVINLEMIHEARVIPVDGRPPLASQIKQWMGESRGHWEGNTLVIETTNFNGIGGMTNVGIPGSPRGDTPTTENMRIVERLTRVDEDTVDYEMTVEDPEVLTHSWTAEYPMVRDDGYQFFEYACNEDNTAVRNYITTSRYERAHAAEQDKAQ